MSCFASNGNGGCPKVTDVLKAVKRDFRGTKRNRRLRKSGMIPAVLYGHGKENVALSVSTQDVNAAIRHGSHFISLEGDVNEDALLKDVQWNAFGTEVIHLDLTRVDKAEKVEVTVTVELRGEAPGTHNGGVIEHMAHEVQMLCPAFSIPDKLELSINTLELDGEITVAELEIPEGASMLTPVETVIVHCITPTVVEEREGDDDGAPAEPEVIGQKPAEEEAE